MVKSLVLASLVASAAAFAPAHIAGMFHHDRLRGEMKAVALSKYFWIPYVVNSFS